ncbi:MAG: hypothetical protein AAGC60_16410 [Acidobacteriota bacterium]
MTMRSVTVGSIAVLLALAVPAVALGVSPATAQATSGVTSEATTARGHGDASCVVARFGETQVVRRADVDALRALLEPPPPQAAATRLAVDAAAAHLLDAAESAAEPATSFDWLGAYRSLVASVWAEAGASDGPTVLRARLEAGKAHLGFAPGPCGEALGVTAPSVDAGR